MKYVPSGKSLLFSLTQRSIMGVIAICCLAALASPALFAQSSSSPQGGAAIFTQPAICASSQTNISGSQNFQPCVDTANNGQWFTVMNAQVKASTNKTLFVSPSLITGLYTNTQVKGNGTSQTA